MKRVAPGIYTLDAEEDAPADERHGKDLKKQLAVLRKEDTRLRKTLRGGIAYDADDHPATDHKETSGGTVVPSMLAEKVITDSHGDHVFHGAYPRCC
jgi:hypothetical protein